MPTTTNLGQVRGPAGPAGAKGATGAQGPAGPAGAQGAPGADGSPVQWDSGWFAISAGQTYLKNHNLGVLPERAVIFVKDASNNVKLAGTVVFHSGLDLFFGTSLQSITSTQITLKTGNAAVWHGAANGDNFNSGFARIII